MVDTLNTIKSLANSRTMIPFQDDFEWILYDQKLFLLLHPGCSLTLTIFLFVSLTPKNDNAPSKYEFTIVVHESGKRRPLSLSLSLSLSHQNATVESL